MKIIIIEDEQLVADNLAVNLKRIRPEAEILRILGSVREAIAFFKTTPKADLIISDIQLTDGLSFEIFSTVATATPIIFCTAYDEYALAAFKANGIEYILKPFSLDALQKAVSKFEGLKSILTTEVSLKYEAAIAAMSLSSHANSGTILVKYRDRLLPFAYDKIALFYVDSDITYLHTHSGESYIINDSLEELENAAGPSFYRANRQFLVNRNAIREALDYFPRKLKLRLFIPFSKDIIVSREKRTKLLDWLTSPLNK